jgi:predicted dehydrogenase
MTEYLDRVSRRGFLKAAAIAGLPSWFIEETMSRADTPAPSNTDKPGIALVGCGGMGRADASLASKFGRVVAVCDVDDSHAGKAAEAFKGATPYKDFRKALERKDVAVVVNGTPDHWHTLVNLASIRAGKDVYSEKPLTLTIDEGKHVAAAVRESKRVLQTGSQQRSDPKFRLACELVRNGRLGKVTQVTTVLPTGLKGGPYKTAPTPAVLNWEMWQGQTPAVEYVPERCHFSFRYWYDYSGGTMTDWGAHHNDIALWGLGLDRSGPATIEGRALSQPIPGGYTAASEYEVTYTYANGVTHRCISTPLNGPAGQVLRPAKPGEVANGVKFEGPEGWLFITRGKIEASRPEIVSEPLTSKKVELPVSNDHMGNFFDCVRNRKPPIAEAEIGHRAVSVCHLGVIAIRTGRKLNWDPAAERFVNDRDADGYLAREMRKPWTYDSV